MGQHQAHTKEIVEKTKGGITSLAVETDSGDF